MTPTRPASVSCETTFPVWPFSSGFDTRPAACTQLPIAGSGDDCDNGHHPELAIVVFRTTEKTTVTQSQAVRRKPGRGPGCRRDPQMLQA